jgi:hypothetical protein
MGMWETRGSAAVLERKAAIARKELVEISDFLRRMVIRLAIRSTGDSSGRLLPSDDLASFAASEEGRDEITLRHISEKSSLGSLLATAWKPQRSKAFVSVHKFPFREVSPNRLRMFQERFCIGDEYASAAWSLQEQVR